MLCNIVGDVALLRENLNLEIFYLKWQAGRKPESTVLGVNRGIILIIYF